MGFRMRATPDRATTAARSIERRRRPPWVSKGLPRSLPLVACLLLLPIPALVAQQIRGRLVSAGDGTPVGEALVLLLDSTRREVGRTASTASGGFGLAAARPGRYVLRVQRIGYLAWETSTPSLEAGVDWVATLRVSDDTYSLPDLVAYGGPSLCGVSLGEASLISRLLESAQTALGLAEAAITATDSATPSYLVQTWRQKVREDGTPFEATTPSPRQLTAWPIRSADPESLRVWGFVRGKYAPPREAVPGPDLGPVFYGPDARVLFTPWFLDSHCFAVDKPRTKEDTTLVVRFKPAKHAGAAALAGRFEFSRASLELRLLTFAFVRMPSWVPAGTGGAMRFVRLADGAWLPAWWRMQAPIAQVDMRKGAYSLYGFAETGGYVAAVMRPGGGEDGPATAALAVARQLGPPPP